MNYTTLFMSFFIAALIISFSRKEIVNDMLDAIITDKRNYYILVICIFFIGVLVRIYKFGEVPAGVNQDGAMAAVDAYALSQYGTDRYLMEFPVHFTAWGYGQMSVLLSYMMIPFIKAFGLSVLVIRLPILIVSLISMWVLFSFLNKVFDRKIALLGLLFLSVNPWHIMQSRWALDCNLFPHFLLFSIYFLYLGTKKRVYYLISMVFFGLSMYTYGIAVYSIPILLIAISIYLFRRKLINIVDYLFCLLTYLFVSIPIILVMFINTFKLSTIKLSVFTLPFFEHSVRKNDLLPFADDKISQLFKNIKSVIDVAFVQTGDLLWNSIQEYGPLYLFALPLLIAGAVYLYSIFKKASGSKDGSFLIFAWLFISVFSGIMINGVNVNRINIIFYPLIILCALGFYYIFFKKIGSKKVLLASYVIIFISFLGFTTNYFGNHSKLLAKSFYNGFGECIEYAEKSDSDVIYITTNTQSQNSRSVSEILTLFYAKIDAKYYNNKKDIYDDNGKKLLPYNQRYIYINPKNFNTTDASGIFILNKNDLQYFNGSRQDLIEYDDYAVLIK